MSTIVLKGRPISNVDLVARRIEDFDQSEEHLLEQQEHLQKINQKLLEFAPRCAQVEARYNIDPQRAEQIHRVWKRLTVEPLNPAKCIAQSYIPRAEELRNESKSLWSALSENMRSRERLMDGWYAHIEEASYRIHLLEELEKQLNAYEEQTQASHIASSSKDEQWITDLFIQEAKQAMEQKSLEQLPASPVSSTQHITEVPTQPKLPAAQKQVQLADHKRRVYPRIRLGTSVLFGTSKHFFFTGFTENISTGGIFIATYDIEPCVGDRFSISMKLSEEYELQTDCEVVWIREYSSKSPEISPGFGCKMLHLSAEEQAIINQFIAQAGSVFVPHF